MAGIRAVPLSDAWALRHLTLCARSVSALPHMPSSLSSI
jgi:hypothetical protein